MAVTRRNPCSGNHLPRGWALCAPGDAPHPTVPLVGREVAGVDGDELVRGGGRTELVGMVL